MLALAGDVAGRRILDAGCGAGPLAAALTERGAVVSGFDASPAMVELARRRLGAGADLQVADLTAPLPYADGTFDDVVCSLVLHDFEDWGPVLGELRRVRRTGGQLIVSVNHPAVYKVLEPSADDFAVTAYTDEFDVDGQPATLTFWHRPLHAMTDAFTGAGFGLSAISEPPFVADTPPPLVPPEFGDRTAFLAFIFFVLHAR